MGEKNADEEPCKRIENLAEHSTFNLCVRTGVSIPGEGNSAVTPCIGEMHTIRVQSSAHFLMKAKIQHRGTHVSGVVRAIAPKKG
jgi:hypothetical protein